MHPSLVGLLRHSTFSLCAIFLHGLKKPQPEQRLLSEFHSPVNIFVTKYFPLNALGLNYLDFALDAEIDVSLHWVIFRGFHCTPTMITYDHKLIFTYLKNVDARRLCTHAYSMPQLTFLPKSSQNFIRHQHSRGQT